MKAIGFVSGIALGMAAAVAAVSAVYPDIPKRAKRDTKHIWRSIDPARTSCYKSALLKRCISSCIFMHKSRSR